MAQRSNLKKIKLFERQIVGKVASYHLRVFKHRVQVEGKDATGARLRPYSRKYRDIKAKGFKKKDGTLYKGIPRVKSTQTFPPDFTLTGATMQSLKVKNVRGDSYRLIFSNPDSGIILTGNRDKGRDIIGVPDNEVRELVKLLLRHFDKRAQKILRKQINIRVG